MGPDTIVTLPDTVVMFVAGEAGKPIAEQAPKAFEALEARLPSLSGRKFYGAVLGDEYRAVLLLTPATIRAPCGIRPGPCLAANTSAGES